MNSYIPQSKKIHVKVNHLPPVDSFCHLRSADLHFYRKKRSGTSFVIFERAKIRMMFGFLWLYSTSDHTVSPSVSVKLKMSGLSVIWAACLLPGITTNPIWVCNSLKNPCIRDDPVLQYHQQPPRRTAPRGGKLKVFFRAGVASRRTG